MYLCFYIKFCYWIKFQFRHHFQNPWGSCAYTQCALFQPNCRWRIPLGLLKKRIYLILKVEERKKGEGSRIFIQLTWNNIKDFFANPSKRIWDTLADGACKSTLFERAQGVVDNATNLGEFAEVLSKTCKCSSHLNYRDK